MKDIFVISSLHQNPFLWSNCKCKQICLHHFICSAVIVLLSGLLGIHHLKESWKHNRFCPEIYTPLHLLLEKEIIESIEKSWSFPPSSVTVSICGHHHLSDSELFDVVCSRFLKALIWTAVQLFSHQTDVFPMDLCLSHCI